MAAERAGPMCADAIRSAARRLGSRPTTGGNTARHGLTIGALVQDLVAESDPLARDAAGAGIASTRDALREARDIVAALLDAPRLWSVTHADQVADPRLIERAHAAIACRRRGMPLPYAVGRAAFRHLTLEVDERVLIPRPETERLVDLVLDATDGGSGLAIDIGTGSGAIALALASEGRFERVVATDVSSDALVVAAANARRIGPDVARRVEFRQGAYLAPVQGLRARAIVSNPPYISYAEALSLPASVRGWEPAVALFSGADGLAATTAIVDGAGAILEAGGILALEVDSTRAAATAEIVAADGRYEGVEVRADLTGRDRFIMATRGTRS